MEDAMGSIKTLDRKSGKFYKKMKREAKGYPCAPIVLTSR